MLNHATQLSWWKQVLISLLAIAFEIGCASCRNHVWPHFGCNFRAAKLLSGSMAAVAALLAGLIPVDGLVNAEPGVDEAWLASLEKRGRTVRRWPAPHHFFGGVSIVGRSGAGADPRRSGAVSYP